MSKVSTAMGSPEVCEHREPEQTAKLWSLQPGWHFCHLLKHLRVAGKNTMEFRSSHFWAVLKSLKMNLKSS